jgi:hypothetical protein
MCVENFRAGREEPLPDEIDHWSAPLGVDRMKGLD